MSTLFTEVAHEKVLEGGRREGGRGGEREEGGRGREYYEKGIDNGGMDVLYSCGLHFCD